MKLTADTITDEQIRELLRSVHEQEHDTGTISCRETMRACTKALQNLSIGYAPKHERRIAEHDRQLARARCAEIINARAEGK